MNGENRVKKILCIGTSTFVCKFRVSVADADIGNLKSPHIHDIFIKKVFVPHAAEF